MCFRVVISYRRGGSIQDWVPKFHFLGRIWNWLWLFVKLTLHGENLIWIELDNWISFSRNWEWTSINLVLYLFFNSHLFLYCILYQFAKFQRYLKLMHFNKKVLCLGGWFNIVLTERYDTILWATKFLKLYFWWFNFTPIHPLLGLVSPIVFSIDIRALSWKLFKITVFFKYGLQTNHFQRGCLSQLTTIVWGIAFYVLAKGNGNLYSINWPRCLECHY